ncbi:transposase [Paenibacillus melissococcoides]|uniref:Transposase n=1 Tax=Paenibacillus melissococcoides TaxID=2912268 RepID=A0ABM9G430_9BACL|nr:MULTISPECIES: transposase [Paenibacillus]GIO81321.1 hypothetical protein J6TS7_49310 [Paenibacillus dendritiformis]CAH8246445.1 transposase [Paenibacillus melissococcoides]CAH8714767.1 transposase [Paenibacillus melissococcoides]CAH8715722.1 transposase [Paenibacillus melissococcoides]
MRAVKLLIDAQLNKRTDREDICNALRANEQLQQAINLKSISASQLVRTLRALPLPVLRDADVIVSYKDEEGHVIEVQLRLVEYTDEKNRQYRVLTNVWDKSAAQICEIYRCRWMIELFFKWMKQHMSLVHLYSSHPEAVWNQIFLALIAYGLVMLVRKEADTTQTLWSFLKLLRAYMNKTWDQFLMALHRKPTKHSKGRRKKRRGGRTRKHPKQYKTVKVVVK